MNRTKCSKIGFVLCGALRGYTTYGQPSVLVGVSVPLPSVEVSLPGVEIHAESDFYQPLAPHGEWVVIGSYGRCWRPAWVGVGWRPYRNGNWQRTDAGWYWVPQIQWAAAWVSWHSGRGYIGWVPLLPSVRISASGYVGFNAAVISPQAYVFVEQRQFLDPIRPTPVVVNNITIINKTTTITNTKL